MILLLADRPEEARSLAFQLTVAAAAGLLLLAPRLAFRWWHRRLPNWLTASLAASVAAELVTLPWTLSSFHLLSPLAPLLNLPALPLDGIGARGLARLDAGGPRLAGSGRPAPAHARPHRGAIRLALPIWRPGIWSAVPLAVPFWAAALLALSLGLALLLPRRLWTWRLVAAACAGAGLWAAVVGDRAGRRGPELTMLDVGQGDSILLRDGERAILVDGGGWDGADLGGRVLLPALLGEGVTSLDAVVMTHSDRDHCQGLVDLAAYVRVKETWAAPGWEMEGCAGRLLSLPGVRHRFLTRGHHLRLGRWNLTVLHPLADGDRATNERSLVLRGRGPRPAGAADRRHRAPERARAGGLL